jgi:hypothetical protein
MFIAVNLTRDVDDDKERDGAQRHVDETKMGNVTDHAIKESR